MTISEQYKYFNWEGYGLHLYIPEGALPPEIEECTIYIEDSVEGDYAFPDNCYLVSAVYWFHCVPKCKFSKPIILEMQHCAKQQNLQALSFVKARSIESQSEIEFNKTLGCCGTNQGIFQSKPQLLRFHTAGWFLWIWCGSGGI